ncbi:MAG TPA: hypothetical protein PKM35_02775 [Holophaga sp.]|nr:hypothetical protein [Holophaga sp.]
MDRNPKRTRNEHEDLLPIDQKPEESEVPMVQQDSYRRVLFGQASDPLFPPHPAPPEVPEEELSKQAMADAEGSRQRAAGLVSPVLRWLLLISVAAITLGIVFWRRW